MTDLKIYGEADKRTIEQIKRCMSVEEGSRGVLCADNHVGYSQPIGAAVAYREHISPSGVGFDIGCGNKAVLTDLIAADIDTAAVMDEIVRRISFGVGRASKDPVEHEVLNQIRDAPFPPQRELFDLAAEQLGTVGAGNHYVDLFEDELGRLWIGVHFGSRGFGHRTASGFLAMADGGGFEDRAIEGGMDSPPKIFRTDSDLGQAYIGAMNLAGEYAYAGRDVVADTVLDILGASSLKDVHNHHNFAWPETHDGEEFWVIRKGCTPAWPGQQGFVGATMGDDSVILEGTETGAESMFSTVHGAGRVMSRTEAAGRSRKRWTCNRECGWIQSSGEPKPRKGRCPDCGASLKRRWVQVKDGKIDFDRVKRNLVRDGIELRGGGADEAPAAYKQLSEVLAAHGDTIRVLHTLRPIGVAMAGADTVDR